MAVKLEDLDGTAKWIQVGGDPGGAAVITCEQFIIPDFGHKSSISSEKLRCSFLALKKGDLHRGNPHTFARIYDTRTVPKSAGAG